MTVLDAGEGHLVVINTFSVAPADAEKLLDILSEGTRRRISKMPGFVSANLHVSKDRRYVTNYAQWRSQADLEAMMADPESRAALKPAGSLASKVDPVLYELRETWAPSTDA